MQASGNSRVALVTGAGRRLGRTIALALAREGWDIAVHFNRSATEAEETAGDIRALGRRAACFPARLDVAEEVATLIARVEAELGPVDALINSASHFVHDDARTVTASSLNAHLQPNLVAPVLLAQAFAQRYEDGKAGGTDGGAGRRGVIVNLLDQKLFNLNPDFLSYTLAKAGLAAATTMLAQALAPRIRVVGVAPGLTLPSYLQDEATFRAAHARLSPLGASSTPEDVAATVVFAVANRSITGSVLLVDGGQHLLGLPRDASLLPITATDSSRTAG